MDHKDLTNLLEEVLRGVVPPADAAQKLARGPFRRTELEYASLDHHRSLRHRLGEVVYGESKTKEQLLGIMEQFALNGVPVLATRLDDEKRAALRERFPQGRENSAGRTFIVNQPAPKGAASGEPFVAILAAGTSDVGVGEEAAEVCVAMGVAFEKIYDVGVAGIHRLLGRLEEVQKASALVVIAGMEGALPSVVAGLVGRPIFAVPTSVGYGASFGGVAALLAMLNSCAPGVTVANIDNGFSAAFAACSVVHAVKDARDAVLAQVQAAKDAL
ncbi:MAG: nickel pincer cofactor biosynthesis protein LarB [Deltaproteobacteria bacterium]|nr:nickel pincer cofactor biosynthesis protein LarB [Deltaproteobacteria bacterium]